MFYWNIGLGAVYTFFYQFVFPGTNLRWGVHNKLMLSEKINELGVEDVSKKWKLTPQKSY